MAKKYGDILNKKDISKKTRVVGVVSGKGGVGKTTFSANLGIALNAFGFKVVVIDCNVTTPHLSYYLGVRNFSTTINNVFSGEIDAKFAPIDKDGVMFVPASERFNDLRKVDMRGLRSIIKKLADTRQFDFIILDSAPGLGREAIGALYACDEIVFVTVPTAPNIMDVARCDEVARLLGHKNFYLVFNMVRGKDYEMTPEKAEEHFRMPFLGSIPFDENIMDATAKGVPIMKYNSESPSCDYFMYIAANLAGIDIDELMDGSVRMDDRELREADDHERMSSIVDDGYRYYERRRKGGTRESVDGGTKRLFGKIKEKIWG